MRRITLSLLTLVLATPLVASAFGRDTPYDQCVLQSLRNSESSESASLLRNACDKFYRNGAMLLPREQTYYACLINNLPGVRDSFAIRQVVSICSRQGNL